MFTRKIDFVRILCMNMANIKGKIHEFKKRKGEKSERKLVAFTFLTWIKSQLKCIDITSLVPGDILFFLLHCSSLQYSYTIYVHTIELIQGEPKTREEEMEGENEIQKI